MLRRIHSRYGFSPIWHLYEFYPFVPPPGPTTIRASPQGLGSSRIKYACLDLCISLLDHTLHGKLTDSIVVEFLAVQGIDLQRQGFKEALRSTTKLPALVKIAQLIVVQYAVRESEAGRALSPNV